MNKLVRITTVPLSLEKLLEGQLTFMNDYYEVTAVSSDCVRLEDYGKKNKVKIFCLAMTRKITPIIDLLAVIKLYNYLKREKPLIVHTHTPKAGVVGMLASRFAGVPIRLHTVAGLPLLEVTGIKRSILNMVEKITYRLATKVYPNSYGLSEIILNERFVDKDKLKVLGDGSSNGIDTVYFNPELYSLDFKNNLKQELNISEDSLVYIFVGRLVTEKGINELVRAFNRLDDKNNKITLLLVGPLEQDLDPLYPETLKIISENANIITAGYQLDVRPYFAISDVLVFPSYREGFPNVVMQAGAMKIPSIVSDINGCNEIIKDGINGMVIPVKNEEAVYVNMQKFINQEHLREEMSNISREIITSKFERKKYWSILLREYQKLEQENSYKAL